MHILVVDDNEDLRDVIAMTLRLHGHTTETAVDGLNGLFLFQHPGGNFDAVVSDWNMPRMDGFEMLQKIHILSPKTKLVLMSGGNAPRALGIVNLAKPFGKEDLDIALGVTK